VYFLVDLNGDLFELVGQFLTLLIDIGIFLVVSRCVLEATGVVDADVCLVGLLSGVDCY
jgi:hypothetical protein